MKRVDRSQEPRKRRFGSIIGWVTLGCVSAGIVLLSAAHYSGDQFVFGLGIFALLAGGVLFFFPIFFPRQGRKSTERVNSWRGRFRSLLKFGVAGCAFATVGLLLYGLEYNIVMVVELGVLVMWLGIALFVPLVFISPANGASHISHEAVRLSISNLTDARSLGLEWPDDEPGLWVGIYDWNNVHSLDTRFLLANLPEDNRVFLAVSAWALKEEHKELKSLLEASGDLYQEEFERARKDNWHTIFASTRNEDVIRQVFADYEFYYGSLSFYPFIVATGDLEAWMDSLRRLDKNGLNGITSDMIENSHCVMITHWEHGLEMFTNKVSEDYVLKVARDIAKESSRPLLNIADQTEI